MENVSSRKFSGSIIEDEASVTDKVLAAMHGAASPRLREVMAALVRHLHAFAREVCLTEEEFETGIDFLNRIGQATHDAHNEGMLLSDAVGFSTLVCLLNNGRNGRLRLLRHFSARSGG
jgi:catechol 1,2-dioxygenase